MSFQHHFTECSWGRVHYTELNKDSEVTVICLHGWLDNWSSFIPLSEYLPYHLIILDLPGHGHSDHLTSGNAYHFVDYIARLKEFTKCLNLEKFHIIGHSMGAAIGSLFAATFPEHVLSLTMIDGLGPLVNNPEDARDILRESILKKELSKGRKRYFKNKDMAIKARLSAGPLSFKAAELLVEHQLTESSEGWYWTYDHKLKHTSSLRLSPAQLESFLENITCPSFIISASEGYIVTSPYWYMRNLIKDLRVEELTGKHHLHMELPAETAKFIASFIGSE